MHRLGSRPRLLIFVVAYNAQTTVHRVLHRIPQELASDYDVEILVIDDASSDQTFESACAIGAKGEIYFPIRVLVNPVNLGYGGNQKIGYRYAVENGYDYVALLHGDGQYAPESLPGLVAHLRRSQAQAVFGSRMLQPGRALKGGMPLYKYVGNKILTFFQNALLGTSLSEFHSGYRVYAVEALRRIPFELNTNDFHFDTEIILQLLTAGQRIEEVPIPTYYGDEISHVNGCKYAFNVCLATITACAQNLHLLYDRKYDCAPAAAASSHYAPKLGFRSPHSLALDAVKPQSRVLDLGCAGGHVGKTLKERKGCQVTGVDVVTPRRIELDSFLVHDLDLGPPDADLTGYEAILLLDVLEHLKRPEDFVAQLRLRLAPSAQVIVSTGNVGFWITRLSLLLGSFNYGKRGILDLTHLRLFTFATIQKLFRQANYDILAVTGTPVPFPLILGDNALAHALLWINTVLLKLHRNLFSFQSFLIVRPRPSLDHLLQEAEREAERRLRGERLGLAEEPRFSCTLPESVVEWAVEDYRRDDVRVQAP